MEIIDSINQRVEGGEYNALLSLPNDWRIFTIQNLLDNKYILGHLDGNHGGQYPRSDEFKEYGIPYIGANDFSNGFVDFSSCKFLLESKAKLFKKGVAKDGDILFAHNATVGPVALLKTTLDFIILSTTATYFRCNEVCLCNIFLKYALQARFFVKQYQAVMAQSTRFQVPITAQRKLNLILPPLPEQQAIATALSDVDALTASLDKLIAKKRDIKQATMQELLTGKTRLPGFSGGKITKLGDFFELKPARMHLNQTDLVTFIGMEDVSENGHIINQTVMPLSSIKKGLTFFERNDILVAKITPCFENGKGACLDILETKSGFGSTEFHVLRARKNAVPRYIFYQTQTIEFRQQLEAAMIGTAGQKRVPAQAIRNYCLPIFHSKDEQQAIATILSDMDAEIVALERKRDKTRALKQGMMQELLTGKTRLYEHNRPDRTHDAESSGQSLQHATEL